MNKIFTKKLFLHNSYLDNCEAEVLKVNENHLQASLTLSALRLHQGDNSLLDKLINSTQTKNSFLNSLICVSSLPKIPKLELELGKMDVVFM